jgi:putative ABC transport system substrate-binding protein
MRRRSLLAGAGAAAGCAALGALAQPAPARKRLGWVGIGAGTRKLEQPRHDDFIGRLRELGWIEGRNIEFVKRHPEGDERRIEGFVRELIAHKVDLIFAPFGPHAVAVQKVAGPVPVVFAVVSDPMLSGLTTSLARPDRNATGVSTMFADTWGPRIQMLSEIVPASGRIAVLMNPDVEWQNRQFGLIRDAAAKLGRTALQIEVRRREDLEGAIGRAEKERANAIVDMPDGFFYNNRRTVIELVARTRLAAMFSSIDSVNDGGLMAYSIDNRDLYRKAAEYVDRVLRGAKPSELPIERATRLYLALNLKTAKTQGIKFPQSLLLRADRVIE